MKRDQRLTRWMLRHEQPEPLDLDHPAQEDIAWAADKILWLTAEVKALKALCKEAYMEGMLSAEGCSVRPTHSELEAAWHHSESREVLYGRLRKR